MGGCKQTSRHGISVHLAERAEKLVTEVPINPLNALPLQLKHRFVRTYPRTASDLQDASARYGFDDLRNARPNGATARAA
jgi:hypothetical protein